MKQLIRKLTVVLPSLLLLSISSLALAPSGVALAAACGSGGNSSKQQVLTGVGEAGSGSCNGSGVTNVVGSVVTILGIIVGVIAVIMIILAAFKYITSAGDSNKVASAKSTLIYALVGLAIAALSQVLVHYVLNTASNVTK